MKGLCGLVIVCLLSNAAALTQADVSLIRNGSFEMDGQISDITLYHPANWLDVNVPVSKFGGVVNNYWDSNGHYSLALRTLEFSSFQVGDTAMVSQCLFIGDVNKISFDLQLNTQYPTSVNWDSKLFSAVLTIDGNAVWDSNLAGLNKNGVYHVEVNDINVVPGSHMLGIGIRANTPAAPYYYYYIARWDAIRFVTPGGVIDPLADFDRNCIVNMNDLQTFAASWLSISGLDLDGDSDLDFGDFSIFADYWMQGCTAASPTFVDPPQADFNNDGIVGYDDLLVFCENWITYTGGSPCMRTDLNEDGIVDSVDFALFAENW